MVRKLFQGVHREEGCTAVAFGILVKSPRPRHAMAGTVQYLSRRHVGLLTEVNRPSARRGRRVSS
jgi:hypothetical protein